MRIGHIRCRYGFIPFQRSYGIRYFVSGTENQGAIRTAGRISQAYNTVTDSVLCIRPAANTVKTAINRCAGSLEKSRILYRRIRTCYRGEVPPCSYTCTYRKGIKAFCAIIVIIILVNTHVVHFVIMRFRILQLGNVYCISILCTSGNTSNLTGNNLSV